MEINRIEVGRGVGKFNARVDRWGTGSNSLLRIFSLAERTRSAFDRGKGFIVAILRSAGHKRRIH
jgi:hypothetical protein